MPIVLLKISANFLMISSNDFRPGVTIVLDGAVWRVIEFLHVKPGKGSAFVRTKLKNSQTGSVVERTFRAGETVPQANLEKSTMQHTYKEGDDYVFMDMESYEENRLSARQIGDRIKYIKEGMEVNVVRWDEQILEVELPNTVVLEITQTDPGLKGDTATGGTKPAIVETGAMIMVPLFITTGERIRIDTRTDSYQGRE
jgi:elongation factor P